MWFERMQVRATIKEKMLFQYTEIRKGFLSCEAEDCNACKKKKILVWNGKKILQIKNIYIKKLYWKK